MQKKLKLIGVIETTKKRLDKIKIYPRETYDDVIQRLLTEKKIVKENIVNNTQKEKYTNERR